MPLPPPVILTIAGSDCSAGAGAQADLKTISALGGYGVTAITCVVAEAPGKVSAIQAVEPGIVADQIRLLFRSFPISALKTGMLYSRELIDQICLSLEEEFRVRRSAIPLVVDPVMVATSGDALLQADAATVYCDRLFPMATLITPNLDEVATLLGGKVASLSEMYEAGQALISKFERPFLLKGGHLEGADATDLLFVGAKVHELRAPRITGISTHGTGCSYSAAIATGLGAGYSLLEAVTLAKKFVSSAIRNAFSWENGGYRTDALNHFAQCVPIRDE